MKPLIVYYSFSGNNEYLAKDLQRRLHCDILKIEEARKRTGLTILWDILFNRESKIVRQTKDLSVYDHIIFIAPIWAGKVGTPLRSFIKAERRNIRDYSFFTLCGGQPGQKEKIKKALTELMQQEALVVDELWINDLMSNDKKNKIKFTTPYRINEADFSYFESKINAFVKVIESSVSENAIA